MNRISRNNLVMLILPYLCACAKSDEGNASHAFRIFTENGVTIAENNGVPKYQQPLFELVEKVRLEQDENKPETLLYRVYDYRLADDGRFYVLDKGNNQIAVFNEQGRFLYSFGGEGRGPGEFDDPLLRWVGNGHLVIDDDNLYRLSLWRTDGTLIRMFPNPTTAMRIYDMYLTPDHLLVIKTRASQRDDSGASTFMYTSTILTPEGDTLGQVTSAANYQRAPIRTSSGMMVVMAGRSRYYGPLADMDYYPKLGILNHDSAESELRWFDMTGALIRIIRLGFAREKVTEEDRRQVNRMLQDRMDSATNPMSKEITEAQKANADFPEYKAFWGEIRLDDMGYYWLRDLSRYPTSVERTDWEGYRVFSPEGEYLGRVDLPTTMVSICQSCVLTIQEDEETGGNEFIVYDLKPLVRGLRYP